MSEYELSTATLPNAPKPVKKPNRLDEVSIAWRRKVSLGLLLVLWSMVVSAIFMGLIGRLAIGTPAKFVYWTYLTITYAFSFATLWLTTTTLPRSFGYWPSLGRTHRYVGVFNIAFRLALIPIWLMLPHEAKSVNLPLTLAVLIQRTTTYATGLLGLWYMQKLAVIAGDSLVRKACTFFKWLAVAIAPLAVLMLVIPESLEETVAKQIARGFLPDVVSFQKFLASPFAFLFFLICSLPIFWFNWRMYKRIRVPAGEMETEQFAGDVEDEQTFGD